MMSNITNHFNDDSYIDLNNENSIKIMENDNKEVLNIKREINYLETELDKNINLDILALYKQDFDNKIKLLNDINHKYIKANQTISDKEIDEKIKNIYNQLDRNLKNTYDIIDKLQEKFKQKHDILNKKSKFPLPIKSATKEVLENNVDKKIDALTTLKKMNNDIDIYHKRLIEIKKQGKIKKDDTLKYSLYWLKDKIVTLKKEYNILEKRSEFKKIKPRNVENIDTNKLLNDSKAIDTLFLLCQSELENIDNELYIDKKSKKKEHIKKEKHVVTKKDYALITSSINKDIENANIEIAKIRSLVSKANEKLRDRALYTGIDQFINNTSKLSFSMFPIVLFKNENIGLLVSSILVNNRIKLVRNLILEEKKELSYIEYNNIEKQITTKINCLALNKNIMSNSIDQLDKLTYEINFKYRNSKGIDTKEIENQIVILKGKIETSIDELDNEIKILKD